VSAPCTWDEAISGEVTPRSLTVRNLPARIDTLGDLWADMRRRKRSLTPAIAKLEKGL
jgi:DNA primase